MFKSFSIAVLFGSLTIAACTDSALDGEAAGTQAPQQLSTGGGKSDEARPLSKDARVLNCQLEYQALGAVFAIRPAAAFETTFGEVENKGAFATDNQFSVSVVTNPHPATNLSFIAEILDSKGTALSYVVLPRPHVGGAFLFELGAGIAPVTFPDTGDQAFNTLRAYCSIRNP